MIKLRTQKEILEVWPAATEKPLVSICCITYNHEAFIEDAIKGFLIQETDFSFEIVIHDDASTDNTQKVLIEYQKKYPEIIKLILQTENQYTKGAKPSLAAFKRCSGAYIALCEGDDYWIGKKKLAEQVEALASSECDVCFHPAVLHSDTGPTKEVIGSHSDRRQVFKSSVVCKKGGGFCPTPSLMFKRGVYENIGSWFQSAPVGDYYLQCYASQAGGALYLPGQYSVYRRGTSNSWSERFNSIDSCLEYAKQLKSLESSPTFFDDFKVADSKIMLADGYAFLAWKAFRLNAIDLVNKYIRKSTYYRPLLNIWQSAIYLMVMMGLAPTLRKVIKAVFQK